MNKNKNNKSVKKSGPVKNRTKKVKQRRKKQPVVQQIEFTSPKDSVIRAFKEFENYKGGLCNWAKKPKNTKAFLNMVTHMLPTKVEGDTVIPRTIYIVNGLDDLNKKTKK